MNFERYNKAWIAAVPLIVFAMNTYFPGLSGGDVSADDVMQWGDAALLAITPFLVWWMPNK